MLQKLPNLGKVFVPSQVPKSGKAKFAFIGEAPGYNEAKYKIPLVGESGKLFDRWLEKSDIDRSECLVGNVFSYRPRDNQIKEFFITRTEAKKKGWDKECPLPPNGSWGYVDPRRATDIGRLRAEIEEYQPDMIIGMGAHALWALTGEQGIGKYRGILLETQWEPKIPVLCTWHPAAVGRGWYLLPQALADIRKAKMISEGKWQERVRTICIEPTLDDIKNFYEEHVLPLRGTGQRIAVDIETMPQEGIITCIGFAPNPEYSFVIPFVDKEKDGWCYWPTLGEDVEAWLWIKKILADPDLHFVFQNGVYDLQWMARDGIFVRGHADDTMLAHYAHEPELMKGLAVLASLYTNSRAWKSMVSFKKKDEGKEYA